MVDKEFGEIKVAKSHGSVMRLKIMPNGEIVVSAPEILPFRNRFIKNFIEENRVFIRGSRLKMTKNAKKQPPITSDERKKLIKKAKFWLPRRLHALANQFGYNGRYQLGKITNAKTRWGSCTSTGTISLNYALMNVPEHLRDYVIMHELTHLDNMNHSAKFWRELTEKCPNARQYKKDLAKFSPYL